MHQAILREFLYQFYFEHSRTYIRFQGNRSMKRKVCNRRTAYNVEFSIYRIPLNLSLISLIIKSLCSGFFTKSSSSVSIVRHFP